MSIWTARACVSTVWACLTLAVISGSMAHAAQPVQFPHNKHLALGMDCIDCHIGADVRAAAGLPSVQKCMFCHQKLATDKPEVKKVIGYAAKNQEIPWQRVYGFSSEAMVKFQHAPHFQANVVCARCHGDMTKAGVATRAVSFNMGTCVSCHRQNHASEDCAACHY